MRRLDEYAQAVGAAAASRKTPSLDENLQSAAVAFQDYPVFIVGYYKSGTSLLRNLLDGHPELVVLPSEGRYFSLFVPRFRHLSKGEQVAKLSAIWIKRLVCPTGQPPFWLLGRTPENGRCPYVGFVQYLRAWARWVHGYGNGDLLLALMLTYYAVSSYMAGGTGRPCHWVEKTPTNEFRVGEMLACFPRARFVHIVRDPRAVVSARQSMEDKKAEAPHHLLADLYAVRRSLSAGWGNMAKLGGERYHLLKYEDLVQEPERVMTHLADFMGIEFTEALLVPTECGRAAVANSAYDQGRSVGDIHRMSLERYKEQLSAEELALTAGLTGRQARLYGYTLPAPRLQDLARGLLRSGAFTMRHQIAKLWRS